MGRRKRCTELRHPEDLFATCFPLRRFSKFVAQVDELLRDCNLPVPAQAHEAWTTACLPAVSIFWPYAFVFLTSYGDAAMMPIEFRSEAAVLLRDHAVERGYGAFGGLAQVCFQFCEGHLDGIEVGRIWRQIQQLGTAASMMLRTLSIHRLGAP
jgi:hypothetical protein